MIIVTLVVTLAAAMVWQQWRAVQVEAAERARMQSAWILTGALDWARLILREDARSGRPTALDRALGHAAGRGAPVDLPGRRQDNTDDAPDAFLSGSIADAQARYNLRNLVDNNGKTAAAELAGAGAAVPDGRCLRRRRRTHRHRPARRPRAGQPGRRQRAAAAAAAWRSSPGWASTPAPSRCSSPTSTLLPVRTPVNVNTASREVLAAVVKGMDLATAERLVQVRQRDPFKTLGGSRRRSRARPAQPAAAGVTSSFFEVRGRLRLGDRVLEQRSLVERRGVDIDRRCSASRSPAANRPGPERRSRPDAAISPHNKCCLSR